MVWTAPADPPFWEQLPVTYIACSDDRAVKPAYQKAVMVSYDALKNTF